MQGLFLAPLVVEQTLRGLDFAAALFEELGYRVDPQPGRGAYRHRSSDPFGRPSCVARFAAGFSGDARSTPAFRPEPGPVPGYAEPVIMSSGAFVGGATIELSCDAPLRPPFEVYFKAARPRRMRISARSLRRVRWRNEKSSPPREGIAAMYLLEVLSGPLDGKTWTFEREITIGRDDAVADACIALDRYVSRKHAQLRIDGGSILLSDLRQPQRDQAQRRRRRGDVALPFGTPFIVGRTVFRVTRVIGAAMQIVRHSRRRARCSTRCLARWDSFRRWARCTTVISQLVRRRAGDRRVGGRFGFRQSVAVRSQRRLCKISARSRRRSAQT